MRVCRRRAERRSAADVKLQSASTLRESSQVEPPSSHLVVTSTERRPWRPAVLLRRAKRFRHAEKRRETATCSRQYGVADYGSSESMYALMAIVSTSGVFWTGSLMNVV